MPPPAFGTQTRAAGNPIPEGKLGVAHSEAASRTLVSVFLTPDESLELGEVEPGPRNQRLDGWIQYGAALVIVVESKIRKGAPADQAMVIQAGADVQKGPVHVAWHDLLDSWMELLVRRRPHAGGALPLAERQLLEDFLEFTERHHPLLMPSSSLRRAGPNRQRVDRRLRSALVDATGGKPKPRDGMVALANATSFDRVRAQAHPTEAVKPSESAEPFESVRLQLWPAEQQPQARRTYSDQARVEHLLELVERPEWEVCPNFHVAPWNVSSRQRWYPTAKPDLRAYAELWVANLARVRRYSRAQLDELFEWCAGHGLAGPEDRAGFDRLLVDTKRDVFDVRPGLKVTRAWPWKVAVSLDEHGRLAEEFRTAANTVLGVLGEPPLPTLSGEPGQIPADEPDPPSV